MRIFNADLRPSFTLLFQHLPPYSSPHLWNLQAPASLDPDVFALKTGRETERTGGSESKLWTNSLDDFVLIWAVRACNKTISVCYICLELGLGWMIMFLTNVDGLIADRRCRQTFCHSVQVLDGWQHVNKCDCRVKQGLFRSVELCVYPRTHRRTAELCVRHVQEGLDGNDLHLFCCQRLSSVQKAKHKVTALSIEYDSCLNAWWNNFFLKLFEHQTKQLQCNLRRIVYNIILSYCKWQWYVVTLEVLSYWLGQTIQSLLI